MTHYEWWQIVLGVLAILMPVAVTVLGRGFARWADRLDSMGARLDRRLDKMEAAAKDHRIEMSDRMTKHEDELHRVHLCVRERLAIVETKVAEVS